MSRCPKCNAYLCDAGAYYCHPKSKNKCGYTAKKQLIKCPICGTIKPFEEFENVEKIMVDKVKEGCGKIYNTVGKKGEVTGCAKCGDQDRRRKYRCPECKKK